MFDITFFAFPTEIIWWQLPAYSVAAASGALIVGCFGIGGGAVFTPLLLMLPGITPTVAAGSVFVGLLPVSVARIVQLIYFGRLNFPKVLPLRLGSPIGALLGQLALPHLPSQAVAMLVAVLTIWAGVQTHRRLLREFRLERAASRSTAAQDVEASRPAQTGLEEVLAPVSEEQAGQAEADHENGCRAVFTLDRPTSTTRQWWLQMLFRFFVAVLTSFISSLSGTGSHLILFPLAMALDPNIDMKDLVAMSLPFAAFLIISSAVGALLVGQVDLGLAAIIASVGTVFSLLGGQMGEKMGDSKMKAGLGAWLIFVGLAVAVHTCIEISDTTLSRGLRP